MSKPIYVYLIFFLAISCQQTNPASDPPVETQPTITKEARTPLNQETSLTTQLDSIDKENNESIVAAGEDINKAFVSLNSGDSTIHLNDSKWQDHRIFGYAAPDTQSERLLLLSIFTNDVENNPFGCKLGAYYDTGGMDNLTLKYSATVGNFVKALAIDKANNSTTIYFEKKWIEIE